MPRLCSRRLSAALMLAGLFALAPPLRAAAPRDELLRLVPDSAGFCLLVQDLRGHAAALKDSPFLEQLGTTPLGQQISGALSSPDMKKLERVEAHLKARLGLDWARLRDDLLGDAVVLAYRPGPPGKPEQEQGVFLLRARDDEYLAGLVERVNKVQKEDGELKELEERKHNGKTYYRRLEHDKRARRDKPPTYYYVHGHVLALSSQEAMLRQVIDRDRAAATGAVPEVTRRLRELGADRALMSVWINPRAFDDEVAAKVAAAPADRVATVKHFALYWKALDSVVLSLTPAERELELSLGVRARTEELPPAARRLFREGAPAGDVWRRFPESALLAVGGRLDAAALLEVVGGFLAPAAQKELNAGLNRQVAVFLGREDFARDVLPGLGPDWGLCVTAPPAGEGWLPQSVFALRVDPGRVKKPLDRKLLAALDFAARLAVLGHNNQNANRPLALETTEVEGREVRYLTGEDGLPAGVRPAYGMLNGYLILASSVDALTRFVRAPAASPPADAPVPLLRVSVKDWRSYLSDHREPIVRYLVEQRKLDRSEATRQLEILALNLELIDRVELRQRAAPGQVVFTLGVRTAKPLKK